MAKNDDVFNAMANVSNRNNIPMQKQAQKPMSQPIQQNQTNYPQTQQASSYGEINTTGTTQGGWSQGPTYDEWYADNYNADLTMWDVGGPIDDYWQESYVDYMYENFGNPDGTLIGGY
tara:strand:+ start:437 stop:790 length:354 start_codon:yes stop_codon:yes gene_type:complete